MKLRLRHPALERLAPRLALVLVRAIYASSRKSIQGDPEGTALFTSEAPVIFTMWHGHLLTSLSVGGFFARRKPGIVVMTSPSRDGELIAAVARGLGLLTWPGSRHKGGLAALKRLSAFIREGYAAALVADGSRGPAHVVQKGVLYLARETQVPIIPFAAAHSRRVTLNTWDRFEIPWPVSRCSILVGQPLFLRPEIRGKELEDARRELENRLKLLYRQAREFYAGRQTFFL